MKVRSVIMQTCLLASLVAPCARAFGQTTWNNLSFGMMPDDIEKNLTASGFTLQREASTGGFRVEPEWKWQPTPDSHELMFKVAIAGTATGGLQKVVLLLDSSALRARIAELPVVVDYSVSPLQKYLTDKYGTPVKQEGTCTLSGQALVQDLIDQDAVTCNEEWISGGQSISAHWFYYQGKKSFNYLLTYLPVNTPAKPAQ